MDWTGKDVEVVWRIYDEYSSLLGCLNLIKNCSGMWRRVVGGEVADVSMIAVPPSSMAACIRSIRPSGTTRPTRSRIQEDLNLQQYRCKNRKDRVIYDTIPAFNWEKLWMTGQGWPCDLANANSNCYQLQTLDTGRHNLGFAAHTKLAAHFNQY